MFKGKGWFGGGIWKPKNPHSLDHLKYLYNILSKNQTVTEQNKSLLVETLRSIAEILIWGDQNDSTVFDFFLEKSMLSFFLKIMKQKCGRYVCIQLLQTLNILFENIRNETSLYYLLSNNHVNSIIVHKFDFSDEEVMAYYISFLKTLSLKLNTHTIHFFYNEHTHDFPLYTEAIKFFNHSESMVRIAVRTLTLNVYKVDDKSMLKFIRDKTAAPYFSNLVWFIGSHVLELDSCVRNDADHQSRNRLSDLVAEHLDHLHYLNDILCLQIESLNDVLTDHLLNRLLVPLYVYSLTKRRRLSQLEDDKPHVSSVVSLFLLSQVFLILSHVPLVRQLADIILNRDTTTCITELSQPQDMQATRPGFAAPLETLEKSLENQVGTAPLVLDDSSYSLDQVAMELAGQETPPLEDDCFRAPVSTEATAVATGDSLADLNITDEEKQLQQQVEGRPSVTDPLPEEFSLNSRPYLEAVFNALECSENDYAALFTLCLLYALGHNQGINQELLDAVLMPTDRSETKHWYNVNLVERLIKIITASCQYNSKVRLATLELSLLLLKQLVLKNGRSFLQDRHLAAIEGAREESTLLLRNFYKSEEIFLDMFEDEYREMKKKALNVEYLTMDANILLPPTGTPLTGIEFYKRLPCGEVERARRTIRVFFLLRDLSLALRMEAETQLPLTNPQACVQVGDVLDLNNSDLIACTVISKESHKIRRFLVIDVLQLILVEPDTKRLGWGVAKFVGFLQDIEVTGDKDDSRCLHVTVHRPLSSAAAGNRVPLLSAKFVFDDHIRCMAAKQRLTKGRLKARQRKMHLMARLLELPSNIQPCPSPPLSAVQAVRHQDSTRKRSSMHRSMSHEQGMRLRASTGSQHRPIFISGNRVPGFAAMMRHEETATSQPSTSDSTERSRRSSGSPGRYSRSREGSPRLHQNSGTSEEIPLEDMSQTRSPRSRRSSPSHRRSAPNLPTPRLTCSSQQWSAEGASYPSTAEAVSSSPEKVRSSKGRKPRSLSESCAPKTLRPPDAPTLSLLESTDTLNNLGVACLLPPCASEPVTVEASLRETSFFDPPGAAQDADDNSSVDHCGNSNSPVTTATDIEENKMLLTKEEEEPIKVKGAVLTV